MFSFSSSVYITYKILLFITLHNLQHSMVCFRNKVLTLVRAVFVLNKKTVNLRKEIDSRNSDSIIDKSVEILKRNSNSKGKPFV